MQPHSLPTLKEERKKKLSCFSESISKEWHFHLTSHSKQKKELSQIYLQGATGSLSGLGLKCARKEMVRTFF